MSPPPPGNSTPQASTTPVCGSGPSLRQGEDPGVGERGRTFTTPGFMTPSPLLLCQAAPWGFWCLGLCGLGADA